MNSRYISLLCAIAAATVGSSAQDLNTEVTIEREVVPEERPATRINSNPAISLPDIEAKKLNFSERLITAAPTPGISHLEPASYADSLEFSPFKGYFDLGYFPTFNLGASAGYKFIHNETTRLNGWLQYDGKSYDGTLSDGTEDTFRDHTVAVGVGLQHRVNLLSTIEVGLRYAFTDFNQPSLDEDYSQNVNRVDLSAHWHSSHNDVAYNIGLGYGFFGFGKNGIVDVLTQEGDNALKAVKENRFTVEGGVSMGLDEFDSSKIGLNLDATFLHYNAMANTHTVVDANYFARRFIENEGSITHGVISLTPYYRYGNETVSARIGAKVEASINSGKAFHIAPDVQLTWTPATLFAASVNFGGGEHHNTLGSLFDYTHYLAPMYAYENSHIPFTIDARLVFGSWKGFSMEVFGGYARANEWLMPTVISGSDLTFNAIDIKGWHAGIAASYKYRDMVTARVSYEAAPQSFEKSYYLWRDRAKSVINASVTVTPISPLDVTISYEYRGNRATYDWSGVETSIFDIPVDVYEKRDLGDVNNLSIGGVYRFTPAFSVFAQVENILDEKYQILYNIPSQGLSGLVGITYKF